MPYLDQLFAPAVPRPFRSEAQSWEAVVVAADWHGIFVVFPAYDENLRWGPCRPKALRAAVGDRFTATVSQDGVVWLSGAGGGLDGGAIDSDASGIDGRYPDSDPDYTRTIDGGRVTEGGFAYE